MARQTRGLGGDRATPKSWFGRDPQKGLNDSGEIRFDGQEWRARAACLDEPNKELFVEHKFAAKVIDQYCMECPVMVQCGQSRGEAGGIWGGVWYPFALRTVDPKWRTETHIGNVVSNPFNRINLADVG